MSDLIAVVERFIDAVVDMRVCVIGETIIDEFIEVKYEGQSMKSFCPVFRYAENGMGRSEQMGGAAAIASHLKAFVKNVDLVTNNNREIVKTRLIDRDDHKKHIEINKFDNADFGPILIQPSDYDVVIVADFGHGFCDQLKVNGKFHYMTQTNSNNFGYNRMSKWKAFPKKGACLDLREASLQLNNKTNFGNPDTVKALYNYELGAEILFLTLGKKGAVYYDGQHYVHQDMYPAEVVDSIGAGDTFYAFACLAAHLDFEQIDEVMRVPALAASLSCTWLCNEEAVTPEKLLRHAARFV
jgi:bifunctional ADP-heptose synthase (sugar kinase/adenylyltransferase)